ncbi:MAG: PP2C family protein-serine/threonine phosphatase, partial [bacterium]
AAISGVRSTALSVEAMGGTDAVDGGYLDALRERAGLSYLRVADEQGHTRCESPRTGAPEAAQSFIRTVSADEERVRQLTNGWVMASGPCDGGTVIVAIDPSLMSFSLDLSKLIGPLAFLHVGIKGSFDFIRPSGIIAAGERQWQSLSQAELELLRAQPDGAFFTAPMFGTDSLCRAERMEDGMIMLLRLPLDEIYASRNTQLYESCFQDILLVAVIYIMISLLLEELVVNNLRWINGSLGKITSGELGEVVEVRSSSEFASLSDDINHTVDALKGYIDAAEKRIEKELSFAAAIQDAALPKNFTFKRNDFELFALMNPAKEVGGDFYDFFFVSYNRLALVIADVSGKGIPAALFMMRAKTAIRSLAVKGSDPDAILHDANNMLCEGNNAQMFVTAWLGIVDLITGCMRCANAGHEYPAVMRVGGNYELLKDKHGLALACMENMRFKTYELKLEPGDRLFVYTDGVPEAIDPDFQQYGSTRMLEKLNTMKDWRMDATLPALRQDIADFAETAEQFDDITMLGFIYNGPSDAEPTSREE